MTEMEQVIHIMLKLATYLRYVAQAIEMPRTAHQIKECIATLQDLDDGRFKKDSLEDIEGVPV